MQGLNLLLNVWRICWSRQLSGLEQWPLAGSWQDSEVSSSYFSQFQILKVSGIKWKESRLQSQTWDEIWVSESKESSCNAWEPDSIPGSEKIPWRREWLLTLVFLPKESHGQRSLAGYSPWGHKELDRIAVTCTHTWCATRAWESIISPHFSSSCQTMTDRSWWRG